MSFSTRRLTPSELQSAAAIIRNARRDFTAEPSVPTEVTELREQLIDDGFARLTKIAQAKGDVRALDIRSSRRSHQEAMRVLFEASLALRAQGALGPINDQDGIPRELASRAVSGALPPQELEAVRRIAGLEIARLFDDPVRDRPLRIFAEDYLYDEHQVPAATIRANEEKPRLPLRDEHERRTSASLVLLADPRIPASFAEGLIRGLVTTAEASSLSDLRALAGRLSPGLREVLRPAMREIERRACLTIVFVSMEVRPYCGAGGLGAVMGDLPAALAKKGHRVLVIAPRHEVIAADKLEDPAATGGGRKGGVVFGPEGPQPFTLQRGKVGAEDENPVQHWFIENERYFSKGRPTIYAGGDPAERYDFFAAALPGVLRQILGTHNPDVVQLNDAHVALAAAYLKLDPSFDGTKIVLALHNVGAAYQGRFPGHLMHRLRADRRLMQVGTEPGDRAKGALEFYGDMNFLKCGAVLSDACVTVSHEYMLDLLTPEKGQGLNGVFSVLHREGRLFGHPNGIDPKKWDPESDPFIAAPFSYGKSDNKAKCKRELQRLFGLPTRSDVPVMGVVARLDHQKGFDELIPAIERLMEENQDMQFVVVGDGDPAIKAALAQLAQKYPNRIAPPRAFSEAYEHKVVAGSDFFLMPSHFEPCGLPQMFVPRYLTVPVVRATGGLEETIEDYDSGARTGFGFKFKDDLYGALLRACDWYRSGEEGRAALLRNGASTDFSWERTAAPTHLAMFREVLSF